MALSRNAAAAGRGKTKQTGAKDKPKAAPTKSVVKKATAGTTAGAALRESKSSAPNKAKPRVASKVVAPQTLAGLAIGRSMRESLGAAALAFGMSAQQVAATAGLEGASPSRPARDESGPSRTRLGEMLEVVARVAAWAGGPQQAMAWYRAQPLAAFGDRTAESLVKSGQAAPLRDYLDSIALGGFA